MEPHFKTSFWLSPCLLVVSEFLYAAEDHYNTTTTSELSNTFTSLPNGLYDLL